MSDIKLFRMAGRSVVELEGKSETVERTLQSVIEQHCETLLGVTFLASEYRTGKTHRGRIDTLGIDENDCPVIIEYKRSTNENVINQGLFYLDWLLDHRAEFNQLVEARCGRKRASTVDWSAPRLLCIGGGFTRYDEHAVAQINRNIDLLRYLRFGTDLLAFELVHHSNEELLDEDSVRRGRRRTTRARPTVSQSQARALARSSSEVRDVYGAVRAFILALGDDVQEKHLKHYVAFRRIRNFTAILLQKKAVVLHLKINPRRIKLEPGFSRDISRVGHLGTGDVSVSLRSQADVKRAEPLLVRSYEGG